MASYGYGKDGGEGGGYMAASQQGSQGREGRAFADTIRAVTIKQILDLSKEDAMTGNEEFKIDNVAVTQVTVVGQILKVEAVSTTTNFLITDGTGQIEAKKWATDGVDAADEPSFGLDQYVRIFGRIKNFQRKMTLNAGIVRAIDDYNEVSHHLLECAHQHLVNTQGTGGGGGGVGGGENDGMFVQQNSSNQSAPVNKVLAVLMNTETGSEGLHVNAIIAQANMTRDAVHRALQELLDAGMVYTTTDDETFAYITC